MSRYFLFLLLAAYPVLSGCIGALIGAAVAPRESAASMGKSVAYKVGRGLAGSELEEVVSQKDTLENLDQILKEHPDAANRAELQTLRNRLAREVNAPVDDDTLSDDQLALRDGHQIGDPDPLRRRGYDRRQEAGEDPFGQAIAGRPQRRSQEMRNRLGFEERDHPDQRLRSRDSWRHSAVPAATELSRHEPRWSIITLGGEQQHVDTTGRR